jgi:hypothetical protein
MTEYVVKTESVPATTGALTSAEVHAILTRLDPLALQDAGAAHAQLGRELGTVAAHLAQEAGTLAQNWSGTAARTALTQFQRLHEQTAALATQATLTGAVLTWLGTQVVPAFQHPADPAQAHEYLTQLTADLIRADTSLPAHIGTPASTGPAPSAGVTVSTGVTASSTRITRPTTTVSSLQSAAPAPVPGSPVAGPAPNSMPVTASAPSAAPSPMALASTTPGTPISTGVSTTSAPAATSEAATTSATSAAAAQPASVTSAAAASAETGATAAFLPLAPSLPSGPAGTTSRASSPQESGNDKDSEQTPTAQTASASTLASTPLPAHTTTALTTTGNGHFLPSTAGVTTPPTQERHRDSWTPEDRNLWGLPANCVPPVIEGA